MKGKYPTYALNEFKREGYNIVFEDGDEEILKEGTADFLALSLLYVHGCKSRCSQ